MKYKDLVRHMLQQNSELVIRTGLSDCHVKGLNSFIINENPRIRLFIADYDCELYKPYNKKNPIIPIHSHKYDDIFIPLKGELIHHMYEYGEDIDFNRYIYKRIGDVAIQEPILFGIQQPLNYLGAFDKGYLKSTELHSASLNPIYKETAWLIIETNKNPNFDQKCYHQDLRLNNDLYKPFRNCLKYINNILDICH